MPELQGRYSVGRRRHEELFEGFMETPSVHVEYVEMEEDMYAEEAERCTCRRGPHASAVWMGRLHLLTKADLQKILSFGKKTIRGSE